MVDSCVTGVPGGSVVNVAVRFPIRLALGLLLSLGRFLFRGLRLLVRPPSHANSDLVAAHRPREADYRACCGAARSWSASKRRRERSGLIDLTARKAFRKGCLSRIPQNQPWAGETYLSIVANQTAIQKWSCPEPVLSRNGLTPDTYGSRRSFWWRHLSRTSRCAVMRSAQRQNSFILA